MPEIPSARSFRLRALDDLDDAFVASWKRLSDAALEPNPYHDPRFVLPSFEHREEARELRVAAVEEGPDLRAVLVFTVGAAFAGLPVRAVTTSGPFMSHVSDMVCHPLVDPLEPEATWTSLLRGLRDSGLPGLLQLKHFPRDGALTESLLAASRRLGMTVSTRNAGERAYARRQDDESPGEWTEGESTVAITALAHSTTSGERHRRGHRRTIEKMTGGELRIADRGYDEAMTSNYLDLEDAGWKGDPARGGRALRLSGHDDWFAAVAAAFRADGRLSIEALTAGADTVYLGVNLRAGAGMFGFVDTYNEEFAKYGAGTLGRISSVHHALSRQGVDFFDPNVHGSYPEVTRNFSHRRPHASLLIATRGLGPRALLGAIPVAEVVRQRVRRSAPV